MYIRYHSRCPTHPRLQRYLLWHCYKRSGSCYHLGYYLLSSSLTVENAGTPYTGSNRPTSTPGSTWPPHSTTWPSQTGTAAPNSRGPTPGSSCPPPPSSCPDPTTWPYPTVTTQCPTCPTTTVTVTSTIPCAVCESGQTITVFEQCLTLEPNWIELVPVTTRTVTRKCECEEQGGTTIYVVTEPCGPISRTTTPSTTTTSSCTTTPTVRPIPVTPLSTKGSTPSTVVFKGDAARPEASSIIALGVMALVLCFVM